MTPHDEFSAGTLALILLPLVLGALIRSARGSGHVGGLAALTWDERESKERKAYVVAFMFRLDTSLKFELMQRRCALQRMDMLYFRKPVDEQRGRADAAALGGGVPGAARDAPRLLLSAQAPRLRVRLLPPDVEAAEPR